MNAVLVCIAAVLLAPSVRIREPSWPMAIEATGDRPPARVVRAARVAVPEDRSAPQRAVPEDRSVRPRVVEAPAPGWPSASVDPGPRM